MRKMLYSLMLSEEVVREVDAMAHELGTNRSSLINQILAEHVSVTTPERYISDVFKGIEELLRPTRELVPFSTPNSSSFSLKSSLEYKYRPTVRYELRLVSGDGGYTGEISVITRTQSVALTEALERFFKIITRIEQKHLAPIIDGELSYALYDGRFVRSLNGRTYGARSASEISEALSEYIKLFDRLLKGCLVGGMDAVELEQAYVREMRSRRIHI